MLIVNGLSLPWNSDTNVTDCDPHHHHGPHDMKRIEWAIKQFNNEKQTNKHSFLVYSFSITD